MSEHDRPATFLSALRAARGAFTLVDMMMAIAVMGILAMIALPALRPDEPLKLISAATNLASDLEFAQSATLAAPGDPTVLVVDPDGSGYWLALASTPETPILKAYSNHPYQVRFGQGELAYLGAVHVALTNDDDGHVTFDAFGRLDTTTDASVVLTNASGSITVKVAASTGSVSVARN